MFSSSDYNVVFKNGVKMPLFGLGTWQAPVGEVGKALRIALEHGYRHIDTATAYANEEEIGEVLAEFIAEGKIKREELFITTKLFWCFNREADVEPQLRESLRKLQLEHVDLYLIHMPVCFNYELTAHENSISLTDMWKGMEGVYEKKLARAIGLSNVNAAQIGRVEKVAKVPVHNVQVECHLYFNQKQLRETCKRHGISFTAYAPIGSPGRKDVHLPGGKFGFEFKTKVSSPLDDNLVKRFAEKYGKTPAQILLRHLIQLQICVIPKSTNATRLVENAQLFDFALTASEMEALNGVGQQPRIFNLEHLAGAVEDPLKDERTA